MKSFLVQIPLDDGVTTVYDRDIDASPKCSIYVVQPTSITVHKTWLDNNDKDGICPSSIRVQLLNQNNVIDEVELSVANNWSYTWNGLAASSDYTVKEASSIQYYSAQVSAAQKNGTSWEYTITNMYTPPQNVQTSDTFAMNQWVFIFISSLCIVIGIRIVL
ncbi:MAG: Cna B-type domain-containing protein, partial [Erysipelotrichaceae bacterium]|nr:Cna B-type domain-containing protein [Erysipelotrichaceae bacterium]